MPVLSSCPILSVMPAFPVMPGHDRASPSFPQKPQFPQWGKMREYVITFGIIPENNYICPAILATYIF